MVALSIKLQIVGKAKKKRDFKKKKKKQHDAALYTLSEFRKCNTAIMRIQVSGTGTLC